MSARFYGDLNFDAAGKRWVITDLAAHVAIAFKRMFPKVPKMATTLELMDSDENRADLEWFMLRYPLRHCHADTLAMGAKRIADRAAERGRILAPDWSPQLITGFAPGEQPYIYQSQAAQIAVHQGALLLGDDVGLGKTISAIAAAVMGAPLPMAVVVQPHLTLQWQRQIQRFTGMRTHIIKSRTPYDLPAADFYIYRYSNICGWADAFKALQFPSVVWDEIQELRHGGKTSKGAASMLLRDYSAFRMGTSATPTYNYGDEIHTIMSYINPEVLGPRDDFLREWCKDGQSVKDPHALGSYLQDSGFFLRRTEFDEAVDKAMPPPNVIDFEIDCDEQGIKNEMDILQVLAQQVLTGSFTEAGQASRELDLRMRQLTGIGKAPFVAAYVKLLLRDTDKVVIAGWHREFYEIILGQLGEYEPRLFTGSETAAAKDRHVKDFVEGDSRVLLMSLRSGAGLDGLQHVCRDVVIGELDWSPMVHKQLIGRLRRPGQTEQVNAHLLWTDYGSDPAVLEMLGVKTDQGHGIVDPGKALAPREQDTSRIKRLAEMVLARAEVEADFSKWNPSGVQEKLL